MKEYYQIFGSIFVTSALLFGMFAWAEGWEEKNMGWITQGSLLVALASAFSLIGGFIYQIIGNIL